MQYFLSVRTVTMTYLHVNFTITTDSTIITTINEDLSDLDTISSTSFHVERSTAMATPEEPIPWQLLKQAHWPWEYADQYQQLQNKLSYQYTKQKAEPLLSDDLHL